MPEPARMTQRTVFHIAGMDCPDEIAELQQLLNPQAGVGELTFNLMRATMAVAHDPALIDADQIVALIQPTGMTATPQREAGDAETDPNAATADQLRSYLRLTVLAGVGTALGLVLSFVPAAEIYHTTWPAALAYLGAIGISWWCILPKAWSSLRRKRIDMNTLMSIAVVGAVALGEWFEGSTVAFLFLLSHLLETWSVSRARRAVQALMELTPPKARLLNEDGSEREVDTANVSIDDRIVVKPGEKFPLDGRLIEGATTVNQAPITGESLPVDKEVGDEVFAGTINEDGAVIVRVTKRTEDTVLAGVIRLVEQAQSQRSASERFVDRFAHYYTPSVVVGAFLLAVIPPLTMGAAWGDWFYRALVLLVIACPCALVISTPVSIVSGLASAARRGLLIKGGEYLESIGRAEVVALDKTGTLTLGQPAVDRVLPLNSTPERELLQVAAGIEQRSEHPIARAIVEHALRQDLTPPACQDYQAIRGKGASARIEDDEYLLGNHRLIEERGLCTEEVHRVMLEHEDCNHTVVAVCARSGPLGVILLRDTLRRDAAEALAELRASGVREIVMLTGDNEGTAQTIAEELGGISYRAELLPADKVTAIEALKAGNRRVVMVGDGINDAPALAAADLGIAMGAAGSDAALETADIALMTSDLERIAWLLRHSRRTRGIIIQNVALSLGVKAVFVALAIPGLATLWMAIAADMGASLLVTFNGLRLLRAGRVKRRE